MHWWNKRTRDELLRKCSLRLQANAVTTDSFSSAIKLVISAFEEIEAKLNEQTATENLDLSNPVADIGQQMFFDIAYQLIRPKRPTTLPRKESPIDASRKHGRAMTCGRVSLRLDHHHHERMGNVEGEYI